MDREFWEKRIGKEESVEEPGVFWDSMCRVGLRSNYVAIVEGVRLMKSTGRGGVIVNISSFGGVISIFDEVYSAGKAANDWLVCELAANLPGPFSTGGIRLFSLYPGMVSTPTIMGVVEKAEEAAADSYIRSSILVGNAWNAESPLYVGRVIAAIAADGDEQLARERQGNIVVAAEAGNYYGIIDEKGQKRWSLRGLKGMLLSAFPALRGGVLDRLLPDIIIPWFLLKLAVGAGPTASKR